MSAGHDTRAPSSRAPEEPRTHQGERSPTDVAEAVGKCCTGAILSLDPDSCEVTVVPLTCGRWECPHCGPRRKLRVIAQAHAGKPERHIVLTLRPQESWTLKYHVHYIREKFRALRQRLRRNGKQFDYLAVLELQKNGTPHLHILHRGDYISERWLRQCWQELTGAFEIRIKQIDHVPAAISEVCKYLLKTAADLQAKCPRVPIVTYSRGWLPDNWSDSEDYPDPYRANVPLGAPYASIIAALSDLGATLEQSDGQCGSYRVTWRAPPPPERLQAIEADYRPATQNAVALCLWTTFPSLRSERDLVGYLHSLGLHDAARQVERKHPHTSPSISSEDARLVQWAASFPSARQRRARAREHLHGGTPVQRELAAATAHS